MLAKVSQEDKDSIKNWVTGYLCYVLAKNLATFCQCPVISSKAELRSN